MILIGSLVLSGSLAGHSQGQGSASVTVLNTPDELVPVTGMVGIDPANSTVLLTNTAETPLFVRDIDNPARQPFARSRNFRLSEVQEFTNDTLATMPAGKRLVIEHVSGDCTMPAVQRVLRLEVSTIPSDGALRNGHHLVPVHIGDFDPGLVGGSVTSFSQAIKLYAHSTTEVNVQVFRSSTEGIASCRVRMSGYLVDLP